MIPIRDILFGKNEKAEKRPLTKEKLQETTREYVEQMRERLATMNDKEFGEWLRR